MPRDFPTRDLCRAFLMLMDESECRNFLRDLCTPEELRSMSERWRVVQLLKKKIPYRKIQEMTGVSTATITRVARCLTYGENGYALLSQRTQPAKMPVKSKESEK